MEEVVILEGGVVRLAMVYVPVFRKFIKIYPAPEENDDAQPNIVVFDEKRGMQVIRNYDNVKGALIIRRKFTGLKDYSKFKPNIPKLKGKIILSS